MKSRQVELYDTTLRDGSQGEGISFSVQDKVLIAKKLDELGIPFIEGGWPGANPKDAAFFELIKKAGLRVARIVAFGSTRKAHTKVADDSNLKGLLAAESDIITIFGKSWDLHVRDVFKTALEENLRMIAESILYLKSKGRIVFYDAEHFFDGYKYNPEYALKTLRTARDAGATVLVLCDTNGGTTPEQVRTVLEAVSTRIRHPLGIHTHNDGGLAVANALVAVRAGLRHVQGTINGFGERCGNADLLTVIANLQLKMGYRCLAPEKMKELTETSRYINEISNMLPAKNQPFVGQSAFAHKAGVHINAIVKNPITYEHIDPGLIGNSRRFLVSELGGKTNIMLKTQELSLNVHKDSREAKKILERIQRKESQGYQYEAAEASFEMLVQEVLGKRKRYFRFSKVQVSAEKIGQSRPVAKATVVLSVGKKRNMAMANGDGPVNALDNALRKALLPFYPQIKGIHLDDYKVRVVDSEAGTAARVRVFIEFRDEKNFWTTVGVSSNIIDASWQALVEAMEYKLMQCAVTEPCKKK